MKKVIYVIIIMVLLLIGCGKKENEVEKENVLSMKLVEIEQIEAIKFVQGEGTMRHIVACNKEEGQKDIEAVMDVFDKVSSEGELDESYKKEGFSKLYLPSIEIVCSSGDEIIIKWEIQEGKLIYGEEEYYISKELAQELYDVFIKYNPYMNGRI